MAEDSQYGPELTGMLEAIGYVATGWARLEHEINTVIWRMAAMSDEDGACITAQIPAIMPRMRALIALAHRAGADEQLLKELNRFSSDVDGLGRRRNRVIHDPWLRKRNDAGTFGRLEITADRRLVFEIRPEGRTEILAVAQEIEAAKKRFLALNDRLKAAFLAHAKGQIEGHLGKGSADFLDQIVRDIEPSEPQQPPQPSQK